MLDVEKIRLILNQFVLSEFVSEILFCFKIRLSAQAYSVTAENSNYITEQKMTSNYI